MRYLIILFLLLSGCATQQPPKAPEIAVAAISVASGAVVAAHMPNRDVLPASTAKLITAVAVADRMDTDHRFVTRVCRNGDAIALLGGGDPSLDVEDLFELAIRARPEMEGARAFRYWPAMDSGSIQPAQPVAAAYNPRLAGLMVAEGAFRGHRTPDGKSWSVPPGGHAPDRPGEDWFAHRDPPRQTADLFRHYIAGLGGALPLPQPGDERCERAVARHASAPVSVLVREMLWTSSNPMAELLGRRATGDNGPGNWLADKYPALTALRLGNFSGLDQDARVTPRAMATFLVEESGRLIGAVPLAALLTPAGWDGALKGRLAGPPSALSVWAKTGTMHYGVGLAGYILHPEHGLTAFAAYAYDPVLRAAYDPNAVDEGAEARARQWNRAARAAIDDAVRSLFP